jgi:hypothetical protein
MPAFDLALCLRMMGRAAHVGLAYLFQPFGQVRGY